jgi:putative ATP-dependent endonuclease of the OLD family
MEISRLKFQNEGCFKKSFNGFEAVRPINIIIGRNNTGKSQLLELVKVMCEGLKQDALKSMEFECEGILDVTSLRRHFLENHSGGALPGSHWHDNGMHFVDVPIVWNCGRGATTRNVRFPPGYRHPRAQLENVLDERRVAVLTSILDQASTPLQGRKFRHLLADRDIRAEVSTADLKLDSDGAGATNVIRKFITRRLLPRVIFHVELLSALNDILGTDGSFT